MDPHVLRTTALVLHISAGTAGLALAALILTRGTRQEWTGSAGRAYATCVALVALTAFVLIATSSTLPLGIRWLLGAVALVTAAAAGAGQLLAQRRSSTAAWRARHLRANWASVTSLVSALAVVSAPPGVWAPVIIIGTLLTEAGYRSALRDPRWASAYRAGPPRAGP